MRHTAFAARIARLEARKRFHRRFPRLAFTIFNEDAACIGFTGSSGVIVERQVGEPMKALLRRSEAILDDTSIWAVYPPDDAPEPVPGQSAPVPEPEVKPDLVGIAIVGTGWLTPPTAV